MRIFAISDLHTDFAPNLAWIKSLDKNKWREDVLIVAGDVSNSLDILLETLQLLKDRFGEVFFIAGNHDVWDESNSMVKLDTIYTKLRQFGIRCEPYAVGGKVWIVPLDSWHSYDETDPELKGDLQLAKLRLWRDFDKCSWPVEAVGPTSTLGKTKFDVNEKLEESRAVCHLMVERNEEPISHVQNLLAVRHLPVITFSHMVPRSDLNPYFKKFPELCAVSVCKPLDEQLRRINSRIHVFGHTHTRTRVEIDGVQYIQYPLGYPSEGDYCPRFVDIAPNEILV